MSASNDRIAALGAESVKVEITSLNEEVFELLRGKAGAGLLRQKAELLREKAELLREKAGAGPIFITTGYAGSGPGSAYSRRLRNTTRLETFLRNLEISRVRSVKSRGPFS